MNNKITPEFWKSRSSIASYNHLTQTIHLDHVTSDATKKFAQIVATGDIRTDFGVVEAVRDIVRPLIHEMRHWVDMNCSLRGLETLGRIFALSKGNRSGEVISALKRDLGLSIFVERAKERVPAPWRHNIFYSVPRFHERIQHLSICFFSGSDIQGKSILFKSPVYLGSMLECCAYQQECRDALPLLAANEHWMVEKNELVAEETGFVYNAALVEYHALAHAFASAANEADILAAYEFSAALCFFLLNIPSRILEETLKTVKYWADRWNLKIMKEATADWPREAIIYYCLVKVREIAGKSGIRLNSELVFEMFPAWHAQRDSYFSESHSEYKNRIAGVQEIGDEYFEAAASALIENNQKILEQESLVPTILDLKYPPIFCRDYNMPGAAEFSLLEQRYMNINENEMAKAIEITDLREYWSRLLQGKQ